MVDCVDSVDLNLFFFFQAEDGIRDLTVTGVQTCALPICHPSQLRRSWYFFYFQLPDLPEHHALADDGEFLHDFLRDAQPPYTSEEMKRSEERRVGEECRSRWSPDH